MKDITLKQFIDEANKALESLAGKDAEKDFGVCPMVLVDHTLNEFLNHEYYDYLLECQTWQIRVYVAAFDKYMPFAEAQIEYKPDKRRTNGTSDKIKSVKLVLNRDLPEDVDMYDLSQNIAYDVAKEEADKIIAESTALIEQYIKNMEKLDEMRGVMHSEAYNQEKAHEAYEYFEKMLEIKYDPMKCINSR